MVYSTSLTRQTIKTSPEVNSRDEKRLILLKEWLCTFSPHHHPPPIHSLPAPSVCTRVFILRLPFVIAGRLSSSFGRTKASIPTFDVRPLGEAVEPDRLCHSPRRYWQVGLSRPTQWPSPHPPHHCGWWCKPVKWMEGLKAKDGWPDKRRPLSLCFQPLRRAQSTTQVSCA